MDCLRGMLLLQAPTGLCRTAAAPLAALRSLAAARADMGASLALPCSIHTCRGTGSMGSRDVNGHHALWTSYCTNVLVTK